MRITVRFETQEDITWLKARGDLTREGCSGIIRRLVTAARTTEEGGAVVKPKRKARKYKKTKEGVGAVIV